MLSIIIPIYNVYAFLQRCLDSILNQGLLQGEYEVILVDDGSTDNSKAVCDKYVKHFGKVFKYFYKENGGVSSARNFGLTKAQGEYVYFMDGDDYLVDGGLSSILHKYDHSSYDVIYFWSKTVSLPPHTHVQSLPRTISIQGKSVFRGNGICYIKEKGLNSFVWNMIIRKDFLSMHKIIFQRMYIAEDVLFNFYCMIRAKNVLCVSNNIYRYVIRKGSAVSNRAKQKMVEAVSCYLLLFRIIYDYANTSTDKVLKKALLHIIRNQFTPFFSRVLSTGYSLQEFKSLSSQITPFINELEKNKTIVFIRFLLEYPSCYKLCSMFYRFIFMKCIYPFLNKN